MWTLTDQLLAAATDALHVANWQRTGKKKDAPSPIPRPGVKEPVRKIGRGGRTLAEVDRILSRK